MKEVQELLNFSYDEALIILHYFKWSLEKIETLYLDNPEKYLIESGLKLENLTLVSNKVPSECPICLETNINNQNLLSPLDCKHSLCSDCWKNYINFLVFTFFFSIYFCFRFQIMLSQLSGNVPLRNVLSSFAIVL